MAFLSPIIRMQFILNIFMPLNWKGKYLRVDQEVHAVDTDIFQNNWNVFRDYQNFQVTLEKIHRLKC